MNLSEIRPNSYEHRTSAYEFGELRMNSTEIRLNSYEVHPIRTHLYDVRTNLDEFMMYVRSSPNSYAFVRFSVECVAFSTFHRSSY